MALSQGVIMTDKAAKITVDSSEQKSGADALQLQDTPLKQQGDKLAGARRDAKKDQPRATDPSKRG